MHPLSRRQKSFGFFVKANLRLTSQYVKDKSKHDELILTVPECARLLKFSEDTIREMANRGDLPATKIPRNSKRGAWRFYKAAIVRLFEEDVKRFNKRRAA